MDKESIGYLSGYVNVTEKMKQKIENHVKKYKIEGPVIAWYKDMNDFYSDWCALGYTKTEARKLLHGGIGEFMQLPEGNGIIRFAL